MKKYLLLAIGLVTLLLFAPTAFAAIAFDASSTGWASGSGTSFSQSITVGGGANETLFSCVLSTTAAITASFNQVLMTPIGNVTGTADGRAMTLFYLDAPASGAHNVTVSSTASQALIRIGSASYSGVSQTSTIDATSTANNGGNVSSFATTLTTTKNNDWTVICGRSTGGTGTGIATGTNASPLRANDVNEAIADSNAVISPAGATTSTYNTASGSSGFYTVMGAFAPVAAATSTPDALFFGGD